MALQFRAVVPYTLSGVLAIIGWWWFFSRKKNRSINQTGCSTANGQEQCTEAIHNALAEDSSGITSPLLQNKQDEIPESCIVSKSLPFEVDSKTFGNPSGSKIVEEHYLQHLHGEDLLNSELTVLDRASNSQELSDPLQRSSMESAQGLYCVEKSLFPQIENAVYKDVQNMIIDLKYPEDVSLNCGNMPTAVDEMVDHICNASNFEEHVDSLAEMKKLSLRGSEMNALGDSNLNLIHELVDCAPHIKTDMSSGEKKIQKAAVLKEIAARPGCSKIDSIENMVEADVQYIDFCKVSSTDVAHIVPSKNVSQPFECRAAQPVNAAQSVVDEELVQQTGWNDMIPAFHPVALEANLVGYIEYSENVSVVAFDQIDVVQERAFQPTEVKDILSKDNIAHTLKNQEWVHPTYPDAGASTNEDAIALHQNKANQSLEASITNLLGARQKNNVPQETPMQAATAEVVYSCNEIVSHIIEENAPFMELKERDNAADSVHPELPTAVQLPEFDICIKKDVTQTCTAPMIENPPLGVYSEVLTAVENVLPLERASEAAKFMGPLSADQDLQIVFPAGKDLSTDLTKIDCSEAPAQVIVESIITCAELHTVVLKDAIKYGMVESSAITSTGEVSQCELRQDYFDGIQPPVVDVGINLNVSLNDDQPESVVVGILLNRYVDSSPLLKAENVCEHSVFTQCSEAQKLEVAEAGIVSQQMAKEIDFGKCEAEAIEQLAMRIVSQVILAATKEILSSGVIDLPGVSCHVMENHEGSSLGLGKGMSVTSPISGDVNVLESNMHNDIAKHQIVGQSLLGEHMGDDTSQLNASQNQSLHNPKQDVMKESKPKCSRQTEHSEPKGSLFPIEKESFDNANMTAEDSGCSVCTSEDGINAEDPLQSRGLSTTVCSVALLDIWTTSEIVPTNTDHSVLTVDALQSSSLQGKIEANGNCEMKGNSPESTQERHWSLETDHSGGSDVNSMDSVDSGCALGKTENNQDGKPGFESKKSDLTVWEVEVPKHLVGRLIGKQGRYVSFLKQTSGAKIYISTLPYTQEFQICHIEGTQPQVDKALNQIGKKFKELNLTNIYAPPPLTLPSLPMTSWLMLPDGVTVEVIVVNVVNAGHMFVQQHTHPTFHALRSLDQQMFLCYSQSGIPVLPTPVEVGVICAAPGGDKAWWRAQVVSFYTESNEVEIRYVDYGGYERVKVDILRQIRSDFVTLPFQGTEVLLDNVVPLPDEDHFSSEADVTVNEMTRGTALLAQVTSYDGSTGLPLIQLWSMLGDEVVSINRALVERGFAQWIDCF